jgi:hypothetical protein
MHSAVAQQLSDHKLYGLTYKIYQLDSTQARVLYQQRRITDTVDLFKNEFATEYTDSAFSLYSLPKGHYLIAKAQGQLINYESFESPYFSVNSYGYNGEAWFVISDYKGTILEDATLEINQEEYAYRDDCNCYPVPAIKGNGWGKITYKDQFTYINIDGYKPPKETYKNKKTKYKRKMFSPVRILPGYIAFNQPKYQLADTVKMKTFLVKENGKPWKKKVKLVIYEEYNYDQDGFKETLKPVSEGAFVYDFPIPDTFDIDQNYTVEFYSKRNKLLKSNSFRVEDYELGNTTFTAQLKNPMVYLGDTPTLILEGKDANDLPLLDAYAKINVRMGNLMEYYRDSLFIPETWRNSVFSKEFLLDINGPTTFEIPDSIFPLAKCYYYIDVTLNNSENEPKTFNFTVTYDGQSDRHLLFLDGDSIKAQHLHWDSISYGCTGTLTSFYNSDTLEHKTVELPYSEKLNYAATRYVLQDQLGQYVGTLNTPYWVDKLVFAEGEKKHDSVYISLHNELKIPVSWQIYKGKTKIKGGKSVDLNFAVADKTLDSYYIIYTFRWQDQDLIREKAFHIDEKKLNVSIDQPETIFPGANVPITVKVTNYAEAAMKDVNLTAWSVNTKFGDIQGPDLPYFGLQHFELLRSFNVEHGPYSMYESVPIKQKHIELLDLYNTPYYEFIYSKGGVNAQYDSIHSTWGEINPFVYTNGSLQRIFTIYANEKPIYIQDNAAPQPMTIKMKPGKYDIGLRTGSDMYEVKTVEVKPGLKTMLCINTDSIYNNPNASYLALDSIPYLQQEEDRLKRNMLVTSLPYYSDLYFEQDSIIFHFTGRAESYYDPEFGSFYSFGPFKKGEINVTDVTNDTAYTFYFEPGYLYTFKKDTSYISQPIGYPNSLKGFYPGGYSDNWDFREKSHVIPPVMVPEEDPEETYKQQYTTAKNRKAKQHPLLKTRYHLKQYQYERCEVQFINRTGKNMLWAALFNHENDSCTHIRFGYFNGANSLKPGKYDVFMLFEDSSYVIQNNKEFFAKGMNYFKYDQSYLKPYDQAVLNKYEEEVIRINKPPLRKFTNPPREINGFSVSYKKTEDNRTLMSGYLYNYHGEPIDYATIYAEIDGYYKGGAFTNPEGYFEIEGLPSGKYMLKIMMERNRNFYIYNIKVVKGKNTQVMIEPEILFEYSEVYEYASVMDEVYSNASMAYDSYSANAVSQLSAMEISKSGVSIFKVSSKEISRLPAVGGEADMAQYLSTLPGVAASEKNLAKFGKEGIDALRADPNSNRIRNTFRDYGFWQPNLITDKNGEVHFTVTYPDNITQWKTIVPAMDGNKNVGIGYAYSKSFKPLSANLGLPNFLVKGDEALVSGKILNYTEESLEMKTYFNVNGLEKFSNQVATENFAIDYYELRSDSTGTLQVTYGLDKGDGYIDGEERKINVLTDGIVTSDVEQIEVKGDTSITWLPNEEITGRTLFITNEPLDVIKRELNDLKNYEYGCNEQTASKLKALLLEKSLLSNLNEPFEDEKTLVKCLKTLEKNQNKDGSWGWWDQSSGDIWITAYVTDAINKAVAHGYRTKSHMQGSAFLQSKIAGLNVSEKLEALNVMASIPYPFDYAAHIEQLQNTKLSFQDELLLAKLKQTQGISIDNAFIFERQKQSKNGLYWGEEMLSFTVNTLQTSMLVYDILKAQGGHDAVLAQIRTHFLNYKLNAKNTIEQATMLDRFVGDMVTASSLQNALVPTIQINGVNKGTNFPIEMDFTPQDTVRFDKEGAPVNLYSYEHKEDRSPASVDTVFEIKRTFFQNGKEVTSLKLAESTLMRVEVIVRKPSKYVLLELPIPAGCSYGGGIPVKYQNEEFRKNYKHKTAIACRNLPIGKHTFEVYLTPRFEGNYNLPPGSVGLMYFPDISSYTALETIKIVK